MGERGGARPRGGETVLESKLGEKTVPVSYIGKGRKGRVEKENVSRLMLECNEWELRDFPKEQEKTTGTGS